MARTVYHKTTLTGGGTDSLDGINGATLFNNDVALVMDSGITYEYILDSTSGQTESPPEIIAPDTNPGTKRWILQLIYSAYIEGLVAEAELARDDAVIAKEAADADVVLTNADRVQTGLDAAATAQDAIDTAADVVLTNADAVSTAAYAAALKGTSTSSLLIEVASKTFTTQASKQFASGMFCLATSDANPNNYMHGQVTSYSGTTLIVNISNIGGSGTLADWTLSVSGSRGTIGEAGPMFDIPSLPDETTPLDADEFPFYKIIGTLVKKITWANILTTIKAWFIPLINPKAMSQAVNMTYAASGSSGITVADNDNIDFGTGNFTLVWRGSLPDWTATGKRLITKRYADTAYDFYTCDVGRCLSFYNPNAAAVSDVEQAFVNGSVHEIVISVVRETAGSAGSFTFYTDGVQFGSPYAISAGTPADWGTADALMISGFQAVRYASRTQFAATYNRALTAAEVLDLYRNGISFADKWGSQTAVNSDAMSSDLTANWYMVTTLSFDTDHYELTHSTTSGYFTSNSAYTALIAGKRYRMSVDVKDGTASSMAFYLRQDTSGSTLRNHSGSFTTTAAWLTYSWEFVAFGTEAKAKVVVTGNLNSNNVEFKNYSLVEIGATLALEPEGIGIDKWFDSSSNALNATYPTAGATLTRPLVRPSKQGTITDGSTGAVTVTIAMILGGIITGNPSAARAYTFETGATSDAANARLRIGEAYDWTVINTNATYAITVTASSGHTVVGNMVVALSTSGRFRTVKTAASTFITYRLN